MSFADRVERDLEQYERERLAARQPALKLPPGMATRAGNDGVGHLLPRRDVRFLCGPVALPERHGWPVTSWCRDCVGALSEGGR